MSFSLNEVEAIAKRASKGAGYSWGLAEEAAKATRWLCARGYDGVLLLAQTLTLEFSRNLSKHRPDITGQTWQGDESLCPLLTGSMLSDCADQWSQRPLTLRHVAVPGFLLPFVAHAAWRLSSAITVNIDGRNWRTDGQFCEGHAPTEATAQEVVVCLTDIQPQPGNLSTRATPQPQIWKTITDYAHRTYAPATEASRLLGAGAGLSDND